MLTNATITVYNRGYDPLTRFDTWHTEIKQRIMYRSIDPRSIKDKDERKRIEKIQRAIELKKSRRKMTDYEIGDMFA